MFRQNSGKVTRTSGFSVTRIVSIRPHDFSEVPPKHRLLKSHVSAYDRTTQSGALAHIDAHEDSRVKKYAIKLARTKDSLELHKLRQERFAHLPHWGKLDDKTKQSILDAEDETHAAHKDWEKWKEEHGSGKGKQKKNPMLDKLDGDHSGLLQARLFKGRKGLVHLLRKSKIEHFLRHGQGGITAVTRRDPREAKHNEKSEVVVVRNRPQMQLSGRLGEMRTDAAKWAKKRIRGNYSNNHTGIEISVTRKGIEESASHLYNEEQLQTISAIPQLIKHSVLFDVSPHEPPKVDYGDVFTFYGIVKQQGKVYLAKLNAKQIQKNKLHYDHQAIEIVTPDVALATHDQNIDHRITPPSGVDSVISLHELVDYVNTMHPEHVESFHRLNKSLFAPLQFPFSAREPSTNINTFNSDVACSIGVDNTVYNICVDNTAHSTLQKKNLPSASIKPQPPNDILKSIILTQGLIIAGRIVKLDFPADEGLDFIQLKKDLLNGVYLLRKSHQDHVGYDRMSTSGVISHIQQHGIPHTHRLEMKTEVIGEPGKERIFVTGHLKDHEGLNWIEKLAVGKPVVEMTVDRSGAHKWYLNRTDATGRKGYGKEARQAVMDYLAKHHGAKTFRTYIEHHNFNAKEMVKDWDRVEGTSHGAYYEKTVDKNHLLRKSQPNLFGHHEEQRTVHAGTRHLASGAVVQVAEYRRRTQVVERERQPTPRVHDFSPKGTVGANIDPVIYRFEYTPGTKSSWGIDTKELQHLINGIVADVPGYTFSADVKINSSQIDITFNGKEKNGDGELCIQRAIYNKGNAAYHANFLATKTETGISRAVNRCCMHLYQRLGLKEITVYANCDVGGYTWGKFGFVPESPVRFDNIKDKLRSRLLECAQGATTQKTKTKEHHFRQFTQQEVDNVNTYLQSNNPKKLWQISDYVGTDGMKIGKALLLNQDWRGKLDMNDAGTMHRFAEYVQPKGQKDRTTQLSLF